MSGDSWEVVARLRRAAEDYARRDDMLAAAMLDQQASAMRLRVELATEPTPQPSAEDCDAAGAGHAR